jgi:hypothetical protein
MDAASDFLSQLLTLIPTELGSATLKCTGRYRYRYRYRYML